MKKKAKITIISPAHPFRGGIAASSERLAQEFHEMGHEVKVITFTKQYPDFLFPGKTQYNEGPPPKGLNIIRMIHAYNPFNWIKTAYKLRKDDGDLFIVRYWIPLMAPALATVMMLSKKNRKVIGLVDNIIPHEKHFYDRFLSSYFVSQMDDFMVMSRSVEEELREFTKSKKISYFPHPVYDIYGENISKNVALSNLGLKSDKKYLLFFGFIRDYKGLDLLLKSLAEPILNDQDIHLIVAGEFYEDRKTYDDLIDSLGINNKITIHDDFIPDEKVKDYFCAADLLVQPYKSATQSGIAQIAYHFEIPMVVTNVGGLPEIVEDGKSGYVVKTDPKAIAKSIRDFFVLNKANEFHLGTKELKERFSWRRLAEGFLNLIK